MERDYDDLTPEAQAERDDFVRTYGRDGNCYCHLSPPCDSCLHPGNPMQQAEDDSAWLPKGAALPAHQKEGGQHG